MALSCYCGDYPDDEGPFIQVPNAYTALPTGRRKRCLSCDELIEVGAVCTLLKRWRYARTAVEEIIVGEEVLLAPKYHCEVCADLFFSLEELGFCVNPWENMHELLAEYHQLVEDENEARRDQDQA